jgi:hypothetical protein
MFVNTMVVFFLLFRDLKTRYKFLVYLIITIVHFALLGPFYLFNTVCDVMNYEAYHYSYFEWNSSTAPVASFLLYGYDTCCVLLITTYLFSMDKKLKNSQQKQQESLKRTLLDRGSLFTILSQLIMVFIKVGVSIVQTNTSWPGSDRGFNAVYSANGLLLILHACLSSYSYYHYASIFRKALHKKKPNPKLQPASKSSWFGVFWKTGSSENSKSLRTLFKFPKDSANPIFTKEEMVHVAKNPDAKDPNSMEVLQAARKEVSGPSGGSGKSVEQQERNQGGVGIMNDQDTVKLTR